MHLEKLDTVSDISSSSSEEQDGDEELLGRSPDSEEAHVTTISSEATDKTKR